jgi:hypothetical protein
MTRQTPLRGSWLLMTRQTPLRGSWLLMTRQTPLRGSWLACCRCVRASTLLPSIAYSCKVIMVTTLADICAREVWGVGKRQRKTSMLFALLRRSCATAIVTNARKPGVCRRLVKIRSLPLLFRTCLLYPVTSVLGRVCGLIFTKRLFFLYTHWNWQVEARRRPWRCVHILLE